MRLLTRFRTGGAFVAVFVWALASSEGSTFEDLSLRSFGPAVEAFLESSLPPINRTLGKTRLELSVN